MKSGSKKCRIVQVVKYYKSVYHVYLITFLMSGKAAKDY